MSAPVSTVLFHRDSLLSVYPFLNQCEFRRAACVNHDWRRTQMAHLTFLDMTINMDQWTSDDLVLLFPPALQNLRCTIGGGLVHTVDEVQNYFRHLVIGIGTAIHLTSLTFFFPRPDLQPDIFEKLFIQVQHQSGPNRRIIRQRGWTLPIGSLKPIGQLKELTCIRFHLALKSVTFHLLEDDISTFRSLPLLKSLDVPLDALSLGWLAAEPTPTHLNSIELPDRIDSTVGKLLSRFPQFNRFGISFWHELHDCQFFTLPTLTKQLTSIDIGYDLRKTIKLYVPVTDLCQAIGECNQLTSLGLDIDGLTTALLTTLLGRLPHLESFSLHGEPNQQRTLKNIDFLIAPTSNHLQQTLTSLVLFAPVVPLPPSDVTKIFSLTSLNLLHLGWIFDPPLDPTILSQLVTTERAATLRAHPQTIFPLPNLNDFRNYKDAYA